jgi:hypothetical protein
VTMTELQTPFSTTVARVIAVEVVVLLALWLAGRYFAG